jgi:protoporphyrinogen oxidase
MSKTPYDVIIVGGGLSGLYSAYCIQQLSPKTSFLILESNRKQYIGGRIGNECFYGTPVVVGAGVGRKKTDYLLIELLDKLHVSYKEFTVDMNYSSVIRNNVININKIMTQLRKIYKENPHDTNVPFKEFVIHHLGEKIYNQFVVSAGFTDYEKEDTYNVLYNYQMDNNAPGWTALHLRWSELVDKLCNHIGRENIKTSNQVKSIRNIQSHTQEPDTYLFEIVTKKGATYYANKVIVAPRINTVQNLFPNLPIYKQIHGQPFLYVYAKFDKASAEIMQQYVPIYTIVTLPLQKIIPMDAKKGVYMIAYSDNESVKYLTSYLDASKSQNIRFFEKEVEKALGIPKDSLYIVSMKSYYWPIGTHYYPPLDKSKYKNIKQFIHKAQHPEKCVLVVGEAVSIHQGWTEGALESVAEVLSYDWIKSEC